MFYSTASLSRQSIISVNFCSSDRKAPSGVGFLHIVYSRSNSPLGAWGWPLAVLANAICLAIHRYVTRVSYHAIKGIREAYAQVSLGQGLLKGNDAGNTVSL